MEIRCPMTGKMFTPSEQEMALRKKMGVDGSPQYYPAFRFLQLGAFWQHWNLHKRQDDRTGKNIISVFAPDCPYPVWHKDEWVEHANPPGADFDPSREIFPQLWDFFRQSPIAHNVGTGNENCEYTDDWWYSKNCYLCHTGLENQDLRYCYRTFRLNDSQFCVFSFDSELCVDLISSRNCYNVRYALNSQQCRDSAFLYDCRNVESSLFCWNLRNKKYCYFNEQLTQEEFARKKSEWDFCSRKVYEKAKEKFKTIMKGKAWHRALYINNCEQVEGNYLDNGRHLHNCYFVSDSEECTNIMRGHQLKDALDTLSSFSCELLYNTSLVQDKSYDIKYSYNLVQCKFAEYSAHCFQSEYLFGCCGLVGKKYYIFNKPYSPDEYHQLRAKIIAHMKTTGEYGQFFPGYFAANTYHESISSFYFPLDQESCKKFGFRIKEEVENAQTGHLENSHIPNNSREADQSLSQQSFWDSQMKKPFQIHKADIYFAQKLQVPLPSSHYMQRIQENFRWMPFEGESHAVSCANCQQQIQTSWPEEYSKRILCEECYLKEVY